MATSHQKILQMVSDGTVSPADGEQLIAALHAPKRWRWSWLINPSESLSTPWLAGLTLLAMAAAIGLAQRRVVLDGAIDLHVSNAALGLRAIGAELLVAFVLPAAVLWVCARLTKAPARVVDALLLLGPSHLPLLVAAPLALALPRTTDRAALLSPLVVGLTLGILPFVAWSLALLVTSYRTMTQLRGVRLAVSFGVGLIVAELASKLAWQVLQ